ncbi:hypothetical protein BU23DRAFT_107319 [Bimuria novae-zelandiae CBS 107.79]|uniref:Uncharacterized protein n=1 Tax=Bimuria novae-zelandiae CBS 107.79 TaxID=1447943 RepID=A0A6A5VSF6_9PLEO|nr:hypothetical protein BU23DRAFT_107319 [Bimuria novae-zelandiae CBS 107.79]
MLLLPEGLVLPSMWLLLVPPPSQIISADISQLIDRRGEQISVQTISTVSLSPLTRLSSLTGNGPIPAGTAVSSHCTGSTQLFNSSYTSSDAPSSQSRSLPLTESTHSTTSPVSTTATHNNGSSSGTPQESIGSGSSYSTAGSSTDVSLTGAANSTTTSPLSDSAATSSSGSTSSYHTPGNSSSSVQSTASSTSYTSSDSSIVLTQNFTISYNKTRTPFTMSVTS